MGAFGIFSSFGWSLGPAIGGTLYDSFHTMPLALWGAVAFIASVSVAEYLHLGRMSTVQEQASGAERAKG
jgi:hypothetical protein